MKKMVNILLLTIIIFSLFIHISSYYNDTAKQITLIGETTYECSQDSFMLYKVHHNWDLTQDTLARYWNISKL